MRGTLPVAAVVALSVTACHRSAATSPWEGPAPSAILATVGDRKITVADLEQQIGRKPPYLRARYASAEQKKTLLDDTVRFEALAQEAARRGYDKDPEVVLAAKQQMISRLMAKDFESTQSAAGIPDADIERYYGEHRAEFSKPEEVRVSEIVTSDESKARKACTEAKARAGVAGPDLRSFRDLVSAYSEDEASRANGGDVGSFSSDTTAVPSPVVEAAFRLKIGEISGPVKAGGRWVVLLLTQKRSGFERPLADVKDEIRQRLFRDAHERAMAAFIEAAEERASVARHDENLAKVVVPEATANRELARGSSNNPETHAGN